MLKRKNLPQSSPLPAPGSDLGRGSKARDWVHYFPIRANESTRPGKPLILIRGRVVSTLKVVCHGNYDPRLKWRTYFQRACLRRCPKSPQQRRFPHNPLPRFLLRPRRGFAYENNWTCHRGRPEFVENSSWGHGFLSIRDAPFPFVICICSKYPMENNQVQAITRTPSGPGSVFLRVQLARRLRGRISMSTRKELRFLGAQLRAVRFNTRQSNLLRLERRNKVRSDSPRNSNDPRHAIFFGPSKRFRCRNQRGPA